MKGFRLCFAVLAAVVVLFVLLGIASERGGMPMEPWMFWGGGMWIFPLIGLAIFLFIIYIVFIRGLGGSGPFCGWGGQGGGTTDRQTPMDVLKMRYAKGEISREEFERMKKDLADDGSR